MFPKESAPPFTCFRGCAFSGLGKLATRNSQITTHNAVRRPPKLKVPRFQLRVSSSLPVIVTLLLCPPRRVIGAVHRSGPGSPRPGWMRTGRCPAETAPPEACRGHSTSANRSKVRRRARGTGIQRPGRWVRTPPVSPASPHGFVPHLCRRTDSYALTAPAATYQRVSSSVDAPKRGRMAT